MSIQTITIDATDTTTYFSTGQSAVTIMSLCNFSAINQVASIHIVPQGGTPDDTNIFVKDIHIVAGDTFILYQGGEKIILDDGDYISAIATNAAAVTAITSFMVI